MCGGIPIINTLQQCLVADEVTEVMGIMNGTTNFMLSKMEGEGAAYDAVLAEAQALGFAEADPTADVEGFDVQVCGVHGVCVHVVGGRGVAERAHTQDRHARPLARQSSRSSPSWLLELPWSRRPFPPWAFPRLTPWTLITPSA